jgi:hypothetical protein
LHFNFQWCQPTCDECKSKLVEFIAERVRGLVAAVVATPVAGAALILDPTKPIPTPDLVVEVDLEVGPDRDRVRAAGLVLARDQDLAQEVGRDLALEVIHHAHLARLFSRGSVFIAIRRSVLLRPGSLPTFSISAVAPQTPPVCNHPIPEASSVLNAQTASEPMKKPLCVPSNVRNGLTEVA